MYGIDNARRECKELLKEGYGSAVHVFINDLVRGGDITDDDRRTLLMEWASGEWNG